jgi:hypothetical protein
VIGFKLFLAASNIEVRLAHRRLDLFCGLFAAASRAGTGFCFKLADSLVDGGLLLRSRLDNNRWLRLVYTEKLLKLGEGILVRRLLFYIVGTFSVSLQSFLLSWFHLLSFFVSFRRCEHLDDLVVVDLVAFYIIQWS